MAVKISNSQWITIVLITAVLMLVFLVFGGRSHIQPANLPQKEAPQEKSAAPQSNSEQAK